MTTLIVVYRHGRGSEQERRFGKAGAIPLLAPLEAQRALSKTMASATLLHAKAWVESGDVRVREERNMLLSLREMDKDMNAECGLNEPLLSDAEIERRAEWMRELTVLGYRQFPGGEDPTHPFNPTHPGC